MQNGWKGAVKLRVNADAMTLYAVTDRTWVKDTTLMDQVKEAFSFAYSPQIPIALTAVVTASKI